MAQQPFEGVAPELIARLDLSSGGGRVRSGTRVRGEVCGDVVHLAHSPFHPLAVARYDRVVTGTDRSGDATIPISQLGWAPSDDASLLVIQGGRVRVYPLPERGVITIGRSEDATLCVDDPGLSRRHAVLDRQDTTWRITDLGSRNGTVVAAKRLEANVPVPLTIDTPVSLGTTRLLLQGRSGDVAERGPRSAAFALLRRIAVTDLDVLLSGEPGSGRRTAARLVHQLSPRMAQPLVVRDCSQTRIEPHDIPRPSTLLLTNMGALDPLAQVEAAQVIRSLDDVRLLGCTSAAVSADSALVDLVGEVRIHLPAVRTLGDELAPVLEELLAHAVKELGLREVPRLTPAAVEAIRRHPWPRNFGELGPVLARAVTDGDGRSIEVADLTLTGADTLSEQERQEKQRIIAALSACAGNQTRAAERLHVSRGTLVSRLKKYGIRRPQT